MRHKSLAFAFALIRVVCLGVVVCATALVSIHSAGAQAAEDLLKQVDKTLFMESYTSRVRMETQEPGNAGTKVLVMANQAKRSIGTFLEVLEPARSKGTRFLQLEGSLWMFNPKSGSSKAVRLSARDSFQGSTFSNADLGKSQFSDDYAATADGKDSLKHSELGEVSCIKISAVARNAEAAYGRIEMWLRATDNMPLRMEYYAKSGLLFKRMDLFTIKNFGSLRRPSVLKMESFEKAGTISTITIEAMNAADVPVTVFNKNYLTR